jgi:hypothetical protein
MRFARRRIVHEGLGLASALEAQLSLERQHERDEHRYLHGREEGTVYAALRIEALLAYWEGA